MKTFLQACQTLFVLCLVMGSFFLWQHSGEGSGPYTRIFDWSVFGIGAVGCAIWTIFGLWQKYETGPGLLRTWADCGAKLPWTMRIPKSKREMLWGGVTCPKCGAAYDKYGKKIEGDQK